MQYNMAGSWDEQDVFFYLLCLLLAADLTGMTSPLLIPPLQFSSVQLFLIV